MQVRFPRGSMFGEPGNRSKHLAVLRETFDALERIEAPGSSVVLGHRWEAPPVMWRGKGLVEGSYS
ncbi:MAG: hypothetical protein HYU51_07310 [Candidatus Rokubacteria bacterium]|nr:hypothetical protein [Candidatus Rokubacteria bacterium]